VNTTSAAKCTWTTCPASLQRTWKWSGRNWTLDCESNHSHGEPKT